MQLDWGQRWIDGVGFQSSITDSERRRLVALATGKHVLEIGSAYGYTTCFMAQVAEDVTAVDPHQGYGSMPNSYGTMITNIRMLGITNINMITWTSQMAMPQLIEQGNQYDLVFIDGDHRYAGAMFDLTHGWRVLAQDGAMAAHDYGEVTCPEVVPAVDDWVGTLTDYDAQAYAREVVDTLWSIAPR